MGKARGKPQKFGRKTYPLRKVRLSGDNRDTQKRSFAALTGSAFAKHTSYRLPTGSGFFQFPCLPVPPGQVGEALA